MIEMSSFSWFIKHQWLILKQNIFSYKKMERVLLLFLLSAIGLCQTNYVPTTVKIGSIQSGSSGVYTNNTINMNEKTYQVNYAITFKRVPTVLISYANYQDIALSSRLTMGILVRSPTQTKFILCFYYHSVNGVFPVKFRIRHLIWDPLSYPNIITTNQHITINSTSGGTIDIPVTYGDVQTAHRICFLTQINNIQAQSNKLAVSCGLASINSTAIRLMIGVNGGWMDNSFESFVSANVLVVFLIPYFTINAAIIQSHHPAESTTVMTVVCPTCFYMVGLTVFQALQRQFTVRLKGQDYQIDTSANYDSVSYCAIVLNLKSSDSTIQVSLLQTSFNNLELKITYKDVISPYLAIIKNFYWTTSPILIKQVVGQPVPLGQMIVTFEYHPIDTQSSHKLRYWWRENGVEYQSQAPIYITTVSSIKIDEPTKTVQFTFSQVIGTTTIANYLLSDNTIFNPPKISLIIPGTTTINMTLNSKSYEDQFSWWIQYTFHQNKLNMKLFRLLALQLISETKTSKLYFSGVPNFNQISKQQYSINGNSVQISAIQKSKDTILLVVQNQISYLMNPFYVDLKMQPTDNIHSTQNIQMRLVEGPLSIQCPKSNYMKVVIPNPHNVSFSMSELSFSLRQISIESVTQSDNLINLVATFNKTIEGMTTSLIYQNSSLMYKQLLTFELHSDILLVYWIPEVLKVYPYQYISSQTLQYVYLGIFVISLICQKMPGVETIYLIQLAYYSLIPINIYDSTYLIGFTGMRYVSGWNPFFSNLSFSSLIRNFSGLKFKSNFFSNVNLMIFPLPIIILLSAIVMILAKKNNHYKAKPRLKRYGRAFLLELPLAILLFNSFNIYISMVIQIQSQNTSKPLQLAFTLIVASLLPLAIILLTIYQKSFFQFNMQINSIDLICTINVQKSTKIRKKYPLLLTIEIICVPLFLAIDKLFSYSLYIVLAVIIMMNGYIFFSTPYLRRVDNIRLLLHRTLVLIVIIIQICAKAQIQKGQNITGFIVYQSWIIFGVLLVGAIMNGLYIIWKTILWYKKPGIVDMKLYVQQKGTINKPIDIDYVPEVLGNSYPKLEYGPGRLLFLQRKKATQGKKEGMEQEQLLDQNKQPS